MAQKKSIVRHTGDTATELVTDLHTGDMTIHTAQEMQPVLDEAKRMREASKQMGTHQRIGQNHMRPVAEVPMLVYNQSIRENWGKKEWRKWLNDPDNKAFRITDGKF